MIDTLARHLAAISEARRLLRMVLGNNPAFRAIADSDGALPPGTPVPSALGTDRYFAAYCHLTDALAALTIDPDGDGRATAKARPLAERIVEIKRASVPAVTPTPDAPDPSHLTSLRQRLKYVLDAPPAGLQAVAPEWPGTLAESRVAIVRSGEPHTATPR